MSPTANGRFVAAALSAVGRRFQAGARGPHSFDCSGLVIWAAREAGLDLGDHRGFMPGSPTTAAAFEQVFRDRFEPGDGSLGDVAAIQLGNWPRPRHCAIVLPDGELVHVDQRQGVEIIRADSLPGTVLSYHRLRWQLSP